jgi:stage V sporulation protein D (sporulation-specific penicillin-binding protein)
MNRGRLKLLRLFFTVFVLALLTRLFYWQVLQADLLSAQAEGQHFNFYEIPGRRGDIKTSDGYSLVTNQPTYTIFASLKELDKDPTEISKLLSPIFLRYELENRTHPPSEEDSDKLRSEISKDLETQLSNDTLVWVALKKRASESLLDEVKALNLKGVGYQTTETRYYPESSLAAQLTGFVGSDSTGQDQGYFGLEGFYDAELQGRPGKFKEEVDSLGQPILVGRKVGVEAESGRNLLTSIDRTVQYIVEKKLIEGMKKYGAKQASALVMDPKTGAILAAANLPSYSQWQFNQYEDTLYKNPIVGDLYEPGSTFKVITMAAALNEGKITPETTCTCEGPLQTGGFTIRTWNNKYYPNSTMTEVLQHSDNIGAAAAAQLVGEEKFAEYVKKFGFGELTGIDLEEEVAGLVKSPEDTQPIDLVTNSFGQGIGVTMAQIVQAVGAIANEGKMMKMHVVKRIEGENNHVEIKPQEVREVIKKETATALTEMMIKAVEGGEAQRLIPSGYRVAGKTGTASVPIDGHYDASKTVPSFVGFGPAEDPKFVMLVRYVEPSAPFQFGSETAAPTFFEITKELFTYYGIPPSQ